GIDPVLGQRLRALGEVGEQLVAVVVEVADQRDVDAHAVELFEQRRHRRGRLRGIHGDAHELGAGRCQRLDLDGGRDRIRSVRVGHRLYDHRRIAADDDATPTPANDRAAASPARCGARGGRLVVRGRRHWRRSFATPSRACDLTSTGSPPRVRVTASALPTSTETGPGTSSDRLVRGFCRPYTSRLPWASLTSTQHSASKTISRLEADAEASARGAGVDGVEASLAGASPRPASPVLAAVVAVEGAPVSAPMRVGAPAAGEAGDASASARSGADGSDRAASSASSGSGLVPAAAPAGPEAPAEAADRVASPEARALGSASGSRRADWLASSSLAARA